MLVTILIVFLLLALLGGAVPWGGPAPVPGVVPRPYWHGYGWGPGVPGLLGVVVIILIVLALTHRI